MTAVTHHLVGAALRTPNVARRVRPTARRRPRMRSFSAGRGTPGADPRRPRPSAGASSVPSGDDRQSGQLHGNRILQRSRAAASCESRPVRAKPLQHPDPCSMPQRRLTSFAARCSSAIVDTAGPACRIPFERFYFDRQRTFLDQRSWQHRSARSAAHSGNSTRARRVRLFDVVLWPRSASRCRHRRRRQHGNRGSHAISVERNINRHRRWALVLMKAAPTDSHVTAVAQAGAWRPSWLQRYSTSRASPRTISSSTACCISVTFRPVSLLLAFSSNVAQIAAGIRRRQIAVRVR